MDEHLITELALVIAGSALLSWLAIVAKQPMIVAYILCGALFGPWGLGLIENPGFIEAISSLGVVLLLFLAGIVLHPDRLLKLFRRTTPVALINCAGSFLIATVLALLWRFDWQDAAFIGIACMFSSTILVVKLLPTTTLHQEHMGGLAIGVLILQDLIAIAVLIIMRGVGVMQHAATFGLPKLLAEAGLGGASSLAVVIPMAVVLTALAMVVEQFVVRRMMRRIDHFDEGVYLLALAWCLANAMLWRWAGLSEAVGAFVAGVALARSPISLFLSEGLKPLRDFFLVLFFFILGVKLDLGLGAALLAPATTIAVVMLLTKPVLFYGLFRWTGESKRIASEMSVRLDQLSEFGLIIAVLGAGLGTMTHEAAQLVQFTIILTIIVSSYIVVFKYPTPIGARGKLHKD